MSNTIFDHKERLGVNYHDRGFMVSLDSPLITLLPFFSGLSIQIQWAGRTVSSFSFSPARFSFLHPFLCFGDNSTPNLC
jgi:hypothetical protein